jgi:multiple sugar transport system substrate-binding protein
MKQRTRAILAALAAAVLGLAGCGQKDANSIRFRYWGDTEEIKIIEAMCKEFEAANPGVHVKPERKNADSTYADVLLQEFAANKAPDVMFISTDNFELVDASGKLADLNPYLAKEPDLKATDYYDLMIKRFSKDGKLLVLPRDIAPVAVVYYNKDLFDKAKLSYPKDTWNWDELRADAIKLTKRDARGVPSQIGFGDDWPMVDSWILAGGGGMVDDYYHPTKFTLATPESLAGILFRWKMLMQDKVMPSGADTQAMNSGAQAQFLNGQLAMFHSGIWKTPTFRNIKTFKWDVARFPTKKGAKDPHFVVGGSGYTMRGDTANPDLCWKLIKFLAGPEGQSRLATTGLAQPALKKLAKEKFFSDGMDPHNKQMLEYAAEHGLSSPAWAPWQEFLRGVWTPETDKMWVVGEYTGGPEGVVATIQEVEKSANEKFFSK